MKGLKLTFGLIGVFVTLPIILTLLFRLLKATDQPAWVWGLFWSYVPIVFFLAIVSKIIDAIGDE